MKYKSKHLINFKQADEIDFKLRKDENVIEINVGYMGETEYDWEDEQYTTKFVIDIYGSIQFIELDDNAIRFLDKKFDFLNWLNKEVYGTVS